MQEFISSFARCHGKQIDSVGHALKVALDYKSPLWSVASCVTRPRWLRASQPLMSPSISCLNDFGPLSRAYVETDEAEADEATNIENILSDLYSHPLRVVAFNTAEGGSRDVTEDVAQAALTKAQSEHRSIGQAAQEFLERTLEVDAPLGN